jgi:hypothetical protein
MLSKNSILFINNSLIQQNCSHYGSDGNYDGQELLSTRLMNFIGGTGHDFPPDSSGGRHISAACPQHAHQGAQEDFGRSQEHGYAGGSSPRGPWAGI